MTRVYATRFTTWPRLPMTDWTCDFSVGQVGPGRVDQDGEVLGQPELRGPGQVHDRVRAVHAQRGRPAERHLLTDRGRDRIRLPGGQVKPAGRGVGADELALAQVRPDRRRGRRSQRRPGPEGLRRDAEHVGALPVDRDLPAVNGQHRYHAAQLPDLGHLGGGDPARDRGDKVWHELLPGGGPGRSGGRRGPRRRGTRRRSDESGRWTATGRGRHGRIGRLDRGSGYAQGHRGRGDGHQGSAAQRESRQHNVYDDIRPPAPTETLGMTS